MIHRLAHWLGWNKGNPDSFWHNGRLVMSFLCSCGKRSDMFYTDDYTDFDVEKNQ